jgi:hypothetical protein
MSAWQSARALCGDFAGNHLIHVTPDPFFSRLNRAHHGMAALMKMFGSMFVLRRIAAAHLPAYHAHPQVNPFIANLDAIFTDMRVGGRNLNLIQMLALRSHFQFPPKLILSSRAKSKSLP